MIHRDTQYDMVNAKVLKRLCCSLGIGGNLAVLVFIAWSMITVEYDVAFDGKVKDVRFDGVPMELDHGFFSFRSWQRKDETHRLTYTSTAGKRVVMELYPRPGDQGSCFLAVTDDKIEGRPRYRIVAQR